MQVSCNNSFPHGKFFGCCVALALCYAYHFNFASAVYLFDQYLLPIFAITFIAVLTSPLVVAFGYLIYLPGYLLGGWSRIWDHVRGIYLRCATVQMDETIELRKEENILDEQSDEARG